MRTVFAGDVPSAAFVAASATADGSKPSIPLKTIRSQRKVMMHWLVSVSTLLICLALFPLTSASSVMGSSISMRDEVCKEHCGDNVDCLVINY